MRATRILVAAGVLVAGVIAAWPFRRQAPPASAVAIASPVLDVTFRRQDITLELSQSMETSPAALLGEPQPEDGASFSRFASGLEVEPKAGQLPPDMAPAFSSYATVVSESLERKDSAHASWRPGTRFAPPTRTGPWKRHRITDGDTLSRIAEQYYGVASSASAIFEANADVLKDPEVLPLGKIIRIPPADYAAAVDQPSQVVADLPEQ